MGHAAIFRDESLAKSDISIMLDSHSTCTMKKRKDFHKTDDRVCFFANFTDKSNSVPFLSTCADSLEDLWDMIENIMSKDIYYWQENIRLSDEIDQLKFNTWNQVSRLAMPNEQKSNGIRRIVFWESFTIEHIWKHISLFSKKIEIFRQVRGCESDLIRIVSCQSYS
jgi:hypothetical protein